MKNKGFFFPMTVADYFEVRRYDFLVCILFRYAPAGKYHYCVDIKVQRADGRIWTDSCMSDDRETPSKNDALYYLSKKFPGLKTIT